MQKKAVYNQQLTAADKFIATSGAGATHSIWEDSIARKDQSNQPYGRSQPNQPTSQLDSQFCHKCNMRGHLMY